MNTKQKQQVHPAASAFLIIATLIAVQWVWWRFLVYREPLKPAPPGGGGNANMAASLNLVGRTDVLVITFAGAAESGLADGPGHAARFDRPTGLAIDRQGDLLVADTGNNCIRRVTPQGDTSTLAGSECGDGDGAVATARFNAPCGVCVGPDDAIYVADTGNHKIRKIVNGQVTTVGSGAPPANATPVGIAAGAGASPALLAADPGLGAVRTIGLNGGAEDIRKGQGRPVAVSVMPPGTAAADNGALSLGGTTLRNVPIALENSADAATVKKLSLLHPLAICAMQNRWLVTDSGFAALLMINGGKAEVVAGYCSSGGPIVGNRDGTGASCLLGRLTGIAFDGKRYVYVADTSNNLIRRMDISQLLTQ